MSTLPRVDELDLDQDLEFQRHSWRMQQISWLAIAFILTAALLGLFGSGPLSGVTANDPSRLLRLEYSRFARFTAPTVLRITAQPAIVEEGQLRVWFSRNYLQGVRIEQIMPIPIQVASGKDRLFYTFLVNVPADPVVVEFYLTTQHIGNLSGQVGVGDNRTITFRQLVYP